MYVEVEGDGMLVIPTLVRLRQENFQVTLSYKDTISENQSNKKVHVFKSDDASVRCGGMCLYSWEAETAIFL